MTHTLSEFDSKQRLRQYGIPTVAEALAADADRAATAATAIGFPVVLKLCGAAIAHKTERDLVRLHLNDEKAVREAADELLGRRRPEDGNAQLLVQAMVRGRREIIVGMTRDPQFGPCVMLGLGGILAEAMRDVVFRMAPLGSVDALDMMAELQGAHLLGPFRGEAGVDREALAGVLVAVGKMAIECDEILSLDINPLIIPSTPEGAKVPGATPVAVDALLEVADP
jgi:succinyl-CoA synthetase beta subunit